MSFNTKKQILTALSFRSRSTTYINNSIVSRQKTSYDDIEKQNITITKRRKAKEITKTL
jgi:hypothetical protein